MIFNTKKVPVPHFHMKNIPYVNLPMEKIIGNRIKKHKDDIFFKSVDRIIEDLPNPERLRPNRDLGQELRING